MLELNRWSLLGCIAALAALVGWASPAAATAIYVYQGNPFTTASAPYDTSDFLSGQLELTAELAPNLTDVDVIGQVVSASFTDGVRTYDDVAFDLSVSTDGSGAIIAWVLHAFVSSSPNDAKEFGLSCAGGLEGNFFGCSGTGSQDLMAVVNLSDINDTQFLASNQGSPGTWTLVPEPTAALDWVEGLLLLVVGVAPGGNRA